MECTNCNVENEDNSSFCRACGSKLVKDEKEEKARKKEIAKEEKAKLKEEQAKKVIIKCKKCKKDNTASSTFCYNCGVALAIGSKKAETIKICKKCKSQNLATAIFCYGCGKNISDPKNVKNNSSSNNYSIALGLILITSIGVIEGYSNGFFDDYLSANNNLVNISKDNNNYNNIKQQIDNQEILEVLELEEEIVNINLTQTYVDEVNNIEFSFHEEWQKLDIFTLNGEYIDDDLEGTIVYLRLLNDVLENGFESTQLNNHTYMSVKNITTTNEKIESYFTDITAFSKDFYIDEVYYKFEDIYFNGVSARIVYSNDVVNNSYRKDLFYSYNSQLYIITFTSDIYNSNVVEPMFKEIIESFKILSLQQSGFIHKIPTSIEDAPAYLQLFIDAYDFKDYTPTFEYMLQDIIVMVDGNATQHYHFNLDLLDYRNFDILINKDSGFIYMVEIYDDSQLIFHDLIPIEDWYNVEILDDDKLNYDSYTNDYQDWRNEKYNN